MADCLEARPDQTAQELLVEFQARYLGKYSDRQGYTLQKYVRKWRQQEIQRLFGDVSSNVRMPHTPSGHNLREAAGNRIM